MPHCAPRNIVSAAIATHLSQWIAANSVLRRQPRIRPNASPSSPPTPRRAAFQIAELVEHE
jgi:hypothetical protein